MNQWAGVILAAGEGVRMKSRTPKVLHPVCGKEMIRYPVDLLRRLGIDRIVVVVSPSNGAAIRQLLGDSVEYATQPRVLGTGDAVSRAVESLGDEVEHVLVQNADVPLVQVDSMQRLLDCHTSQAHQMTMLTVAGILTNDLGRVVRNDMGQVTDIVEAADWPGPPDAPAEVNVGTYCFQSRWLLDNLNQIPPSPKGEIYLTSLVAMGNGQGDSIQGVAAGDPTEMMGVNNRVQLAQVESVQRQRILGQLMLSGVTIQDPASVYIEAGVTVGQDSLILPNTVLTGQTTIGEDCLIGPNSMIRDSSVGDRCRVTASVLEEAVMENDIDIGPFSHLRPGAHLESGVHIGNFVEVKNSRFAAGAVSGHFSYLGDATIGASVNIGAGTITCNYDGKHKLHTIIGAGAFIGCDTMLVAPVTVGADAVTGAGSVVTKDVPAGRLAVGVPARILDKTPNKS
ncbi:MAG: bifunctional UDP-N-acetylglucosamine diphosphorylase/glucosamine-1-phosphate N-acetyltransferase GlmU [Chloroflexi bacterium]|nr:bifunctional UDP-N-acetylglucosamine diphosphorylase/glucosamine-1-phosphate N-acetyltransferase GlmU [Chloroflexota bacterium]